MTTYELMVKTNHYLIEGEELTEGQKTRIVNTFLAELSTDQTRKKFYDGVRFSGNSDDSGRRMYPVFFIPPYNNGRKYKTILNQTPKTQILSANMYELEIIRLLFILAPDNNDVLEMVNATLNRLRTTCFGHADDGVGECFDASLVVLRFLSSVASTDTGWIQSRLKNYKDHKDEKKRPWFSKWYYWLCLSEMPFDLASDEIFIYKNEIVNILQSKSYAIKNDEEKAFHIALLSLLRNVISRLPEYEYLRNRKPYICEKDHKIYFDMQPYSISRVLSTTFNILIVEVMDCESLETD